MKIINIHERVYDHPVEVIGKVLSTLSSSDDRLWPHENWPPMILSNGLKEYSHGGHGPIRYFVSNYEESSSVEFTFTKPQEFIGTHRFDLTRISGGSTRLRHTIQMSLNLKGIIIWYFAIKWLHDGLLEDCLDKVHNQINEKRVQSPHNIWVKILRGILKRKK